MLDELYLTIEPISFGCGISLFENQQTTKWKLRAIKKLNNVGTILLHYTLK
jgi:dihydrofolate reductase